MKLPDWHEEPVGRKHNRESFDCGEPELNDFLRLYARQSHESGGAKTFLAIENSSGRVLGYYSLSPASIAYSRTPDDIRRGLGRHEVPAFRLARLAVEIDLQGFGLGGQLLLAAARRCVLAAAEVGGVALLIDAKNERAAAWYERYGAVPLTDAPRSLVLPLKTLAVILRREGKL